MDYFKKYKLAITAAIVLAILNIVILLVIYFFPAGPPFPPGQDLTATGLQNELHFTELQKQQYAEVRTILSARGDSVTAIQLRALDSLFRMVNGDTINQGNVMQQARIVGDMETKHILDVFDHFRSVREICTPEQRVKFNATLRKVMSMAHDMPPSLLGQSPVPKQ